MLAVCVLVLVAFPFAAELAASGQPIAPAAAEPALPAAPRAPPLRDMPAFAGASPDRAVLTDAVAMHAALVRAVDGLFAPRDRAAILRAAAGTPAGRLLDRTPLDGDAANDLGALLILAAARFPGDERLAGAAPLAYSVLLRARTGGACLPQLNFAFLLAADAALREAQVAREYRRAEQACRGDPTPLWLVGQAHSIRALVEGGDQAAHVRGALAAFRRLQREFPGSSAGWAGEADAELRTAYLIDAEQPFTARAHFERALALYRRAQRLDRDPSLAAGTARALAGLHRYGEAVAAQERAGGSAPIVARLVEYRERAGRFGAAADAAAGLASSPGFPTGPGLYAGLSDDWAVARPVHAEDLAEPLSTGAGRLDPVVVRLAPRPIGGQGAGVSDFSYIPAFRAVNTVTGYRRWCPSWSHRRDLVLAGRAGEALAGMPAGFTDIRTGRRCAGTSTAGAARLRAVARLEAGTANAHDAAPEVHDARQNLWRFAGRLDHATAATAAWMRARPNDRHAVTRAGEVAFLAGDYDAAAALFSRALRAAWSAHPAGSIEEAAAQLDRGSALELAGRLPEARAALAAADEAGSRLGGQGDQVAYFARLAGGDTELRAHRYAAAAELYAAALPLAPKGATARPEVLHNNRALVEAQLGHGETALAAARSAVAADPGSPPFRLTLGFALSQLGRWPEAAGEYRRAATGEPMLAPAWSDLGVALARNGRDDEAADAFRHAVGARPDYGVGWFNLGVALQRSGIAHAVAAEGAFARAFRADGNLRGRKRTYVTEDAPYITTLDLSKPLPPRWELTKSTERAPVAAVGLALALLLGLRLTRSLASRGLAGGAAKRWLEIGRELLGRLPALLRYTSAAVAVAATVAVFLWPLLRAGDATAASLALEAAGVLVLIVIVLRARVLAARQAHVRLRQRAWVPAIAAGAVAAAAGLAWAPMPVAETDRPASALHWIGPMLTGVAALALLILAAWLAVPLTAALGAAALVMTASMLVPLEPLDGGHIANGTAGVAANLALLGGALFVLLGLS